MDPANQALRRFGSRLREEREGRGYSQDELAHRAGLDRTYVSGVERGVRNLSLKNIERLAAALGLEPGTLLAPGAERLDPLLPDDQALRWNPTASIECGFSANADDVTNAVRRTNRVLRNLPRSLFKTIDLKAQSGIVGAVFAAELATAVNALPNPIEKGHPDIVPTSALGATEAELRNYPAGLEVKSTLGGVPKGSQLGPGESRIEALANVVWQAHHRDVRALMGLIWDFAGGTRDEPAHPAVTGVFYSNELLEEDWGAISGTTGRNTKVTGMTVSGRRKMAAGAIAVVDDPIYLDRYARCLGLASFSGLQVPRE